MALHSAFRPHERVVLVTSGASRTRQEFAEECDVNMLMKRYQKTGVLPQYGVERPAQYLDLADVPDFHSAMQLLVDADNAFMRLPAAVRREFDNSAQEFVAFASDPQNIDQMRSWGLAPPKAAEPVEIPVAQPPVVPGAPSVVPAAVLPTQ